MTETFPVTRSDAEWRQILTPDQYRVMRGHGTERPGSCSLLREKRPGRFCCAGCGQPPVSVGRQIRKRHRLAQLQRSATGVCGHNGRPLARHGPHRGALQPVRIASGPCVRGWTAAHLPALLHQWRGAGFCAELIRSMASRIRSAASNRPRARAACSAVSPSAFVRAGFAP